MRETALAQLLGDRDHLVIATQAPAVDGEVKGSSTREMHPAVDRAHQLQIQSPLEQQSKEIGLVVVRMPDLDAFLSAERFEGPQRSWIEWEPVGYEVQGAALSQGLSDHVTEVLIFRPVQVGRLFV